MQVTPYVSQRDLRTRETLEEHDEPPVNFWNLHDMIRTNRRQAVSKRSR